MPKILLVFVFIFFVASQSQGGEAWKVLNRTIDQNGGSWQVNYKLKNTIGKPIKISNTNLKVAVVGDVSNSSVPGHSLPKTSRHSLVNGGLKTTNELIKFDNENDSCGEKLEVFFEHSGPDISEALIDFVLNDNDCFLLKLRFSHEHPVYGNYDPLLGEKHLNLSVGDLQLTDTILLDNPLKDSGLSSTDLMSKIPEDRRDSTVLYDGPYSLHLEAHVPGNQYYRFPEIPVKYSTKMRMHFKYLVAKGSCDDLSFRISQYKDTPSAWKVLSNGAFEQNLSTTLFGMRFKNVGMWQSYDKVVQVQPDATTIAIDFRLKGGTEVGEAWISEIMFEPVNAKKQQSEP